MNADTMALLRYFYESIDIFILIMVRVVAFFLLVPVLSSMNIPVVIRILVSLCVTVMIFMSGSVSGDAAVYGDNVNGYFMLIVNEFFTGVMMGFMVFAVFNLIYYTCHWIEHEIGLAMANVLDPMSQIQVPILGNIFFLAASAILVVTGGLNGFIGVFYSSYTLLPIGSAKILNNPLLALSALTMLTQFINLAIRIAFPIVGSIVVLNVALGIMVKAAPQMNVFVVGMPIKVLVGLILVYLVLAPALLTIYNMVYDMAYEALIDVIWGMADG